MFPPTNSSPPGSTAASDLNQDPAAQSRRAALLRTRHELEVRVENNDGLRVQLAGELDLHQCEKFTAMIEKMYVPSIELDLSELEFIDSSGMRCLILLKRRVEQDQGKLEIRTGRSPVMRAFMASGLIDILDITSDDRDQDAATSPQ